MGYRVQTYILTPINPDTHPICLPHGLH